MVMYREVCPEGVQNKCPGGVWCRGFISWGDTLMLVISRGVQLYYGIAQCVTSLQGHRKIKSVTDNVVSGRLKWWYVQIFFLAHCKTGFYVLCCVCVCVCGIAIRSGLLVELCAAV